LEGVGKLPVGAGRAIDWEDKLTTTYMKKLFSMVMVALIALVIVGCEKKPDDAAAGAGTNAPAK
jgi:hypothetical protein